MNNFDQILNEIPQIEEPSLIQRERQAPRKIRRKLEFNGKSKDELKILYDIHKQEEELLHVLTSGVIEESSLPPIDTAGANKENKTSNAK